MELCITYYNTFLESSNKKRLGKDAQAYIL